MDLADLTLADFEPLVGDVFAIAAEPAASELELVEANNAGVRPGGRDAFSLLFRGPRDAVLPQAMYRIEHAALGAHEIFIVPIGRDDAGTSYEAIFT